MRVLLHILTALLLCLCYAYIFQNRLLYGCGSVQQNLPPGAFGLPTPVSLHEGFLHPGVLHAFERPGSDTVVYYLHGNGVRRENDYWRISQLYGVCNCSIYAVEILNCAAPTFFGNSWHSIVRSLNDAFWVSLDSTKDNYVLAASLGTAHALTTYAYMKWGHQSTIRGIILENPFTTVGAVISSNAPRGLQSVLFNRWDNKAGISHVHSDMPVLFLTSERDEIVPPSHSTQLYEACASTMKRQVVLSGALHGHAASHPDYLPAIVEFMSLNKRKT